MAARFPSIPTASPPTGISATQARVIEASQHSGLHPSPLKIANTPTDIRPEGNKPLPEWTKDPGTTHDRLSKERLFAEPVSTHAATKAVQSYQQTAKA